MPTDDLLRLDDIATEYFNLSPLCAIRKAALGTLPIPAFRLTSTGRGPMYVTKASLAAYVEGRISAAVKLHSKMAAVA